MSFEMFYLRNRCIKQSLGRYSQHVARVPFVAHGVSKNYTEILFKTIIFSPYSQSQSQSHIATDGQSVCLSWCRAPSGAHDQILITGWQLLSCPWEGAVSDERTGMSFVSQSAILGQSSVCTIFTFYMCHMLLNTYTIYTRPLSVRAQ
jgi:hypothetical protein